MAQQAKMVISKTSGRSESLTMHTCTAMTYNMAIIDRIEFSDATAPMYNISVMFFSKLNGTDKYWS